jgi:hypothetical protein
MKIGSSLGGSGGWRFALAPPAARSLPPLILVLLEEMAHDRLGVVAVLDEHVDHFAERSTDLGGQSPG